MAMNWRIQSILSPLSLSSRRRRSRSQAQLLRPIDRPSRRSSPTSVAEQELTRKLEDAGYTQVRDIKSTAEGIAAKATKDGKEISLVADSSSKFRERRGRR
jgi:hypothetical protein